MTRRRKRKRERKRQQGRTVSLSNQESAHSRFVDDPNDNHPDDIEAKSTKNNLHVSLATFSHRSNKPSVRKESDR